MKQSEGPPPVAEGRAWEDAGGNRRGLTLPDSTWQGSRRGFLRVGVLGAVLLSLVAPGRFLRASQEPATEIFGAFQAPHQRRILRACAARVLSQVLPEGGEARSKALDTVLAGCGRYMAHMPLPVQDEARDALNLLDFTLARWLLGGPRAGWDAASPGEIDAFLDNLRFSRFALKRSLYQFLHDMGLIGWFGHPDSWVMLDYPGPPNLPRPEGEKPL